MSDQRGQGSVEYIGIVLLVAVVLGAAVALLEATGVGERVMAGFMRALCIVTGGPCDEVSHACVTSSDQHTDGTELKVMFVRLGGRNIELRERMADGRVAVTYIEGGEGGLDFGSGAEVHVRWGSRSYAVGSEFRAAMLAEHSSGRTWVVPNDDAVGPLIDQIRLEARTRRPKLPSRDWPSMGVYPREIHAPPADESFSERGTELRVDLVGGRGSAHLSSAQAYGERIDHRTGQRTVYVRTNSALAGAVALTAGAGVGGVVSDRYGITYDARGQPLDFEVLSTLDVAGTASLPPQLSRIAGAMHVALAGDRHIETEQHLDLTDPVNAARVAGYLRAFGRHAGLGAAAGGLRDRLESAGSTRLRTYAASSSAHEVGGDARLVGVGVGGEIGSENISRTLRSALVRGPGGRWQADTSCASGAPVV